MMVVFSKRAALVECNVGGGNREKHTARRHRKTTHGIPGLRDGDKFQSGVTSAHIRSYAMDTPKKPRENSMEKQLGGATPKNAKNASRRNPSHL